MCTFTKTRFTSHINFIGRCLRRRVVPVGFLVKFNAATFSNGDVRNTKSITNTCSRQLMQATIRSMTLKRDLPSRVIDKYCDQLQGACSQDDFHRVRGHIHELNSRIYNYLKYIKDKKLAALCSASNHGNPSNTPPTSMVDHQRKLVVTIPADLPLTEAERDLFWARDLTFVPRRLTNFKRRQTAKTFTVAYSCELIFTMMGESESEPPPDSLDPFAKFNPKESTWTPLITTLIVVVAP